jgi:hypothetical protein
VESPGLGGWGDECAGGECGVVGVGGGAGELAGLDTELGSVLQESLGGTAAHWGLVTLDHAVRESGALDSIIIYWWEVAEGTSATVLWECGLGSVCLCDVLDDLILLLGLFDGILTGLLSGCEGSALACVSGSVEDGLSGIHLVLEGGFDPGGEL